MPLRWARFVIVGVTHGPGFHPNPCFARQVRWVSHHHRQLGLYAMTTFPHQREILRYGRSGPFVLANRLTRLRNAGYAEALFNGRTIRRAHLQVPTIWVDVEPYPRSPWSRSRVANRAVVAGALRGYHQLGYRTGIYTYAGGWQQVVGSWRLPHIPVWTPVGHRGARKARAACHRSGPSGGTAWLGQWSSIHRDYDVICPRAPRKSLLFR